MRSKTGSISKAHIPLKTAFALATQANEIDTNNIHANVFDHQSLALGDLSIALGP